MTAERLLAALRGEGFVLSMEGERLMVRPGARLSPEQRESLRLHADGIKALLAPWNDAEAEALVNDCRKRRDSRGLFDIDWDRNGDFLKAADAIDDAWDARSMPSLRVAVKKYIAATEGRPGRQ